MRNQPAFAEVTLAAGLLGAQPVAINWHFTGDDLRHVLADSAPRVVVADADLVPPADLVYSATVLRTPDLDAWSDGFELRDTGVAAPPTSVIYTSGTTGNPKGITRSAITDEQRQSGFRTSMQTQGIAPGVRSLLAAPLYHTAPNVALLTAAALEVDLTLHDRFDPELFLATVEQAAHPADVHGAHHVRPPAAAARGGAERATTSRRCRPSCTPRRRAHRTSRRS